MYVHVLQPSESHKQRLMILLAAALVALHACLYASLDSHSAGILSLSNRGKLASKHVDTEAKFVEGGL